MERITLNENNSNNNNNNNENNKNNNENNENENTKPKLKKFLLKLDNVEYTKNLTPIEVFKFLDNQKLQVLDIKDIYNSTDLLKFSKKKELYEAEVDIFNFTFDEKLLENNDIRYLESLNNLSVSGKGARRKSIKVCDAALATRNIDFTQFFSLLNKSNSPIKQSILEFCDIYTLARIGLVNKKFYNFIFKFCNLTESIENLSEAIFKWSGLYKEYEKKLKDVYAGSHLNMINIRPRVFFSGIYYEKLTNVLGIKDKNEVKKVKKDDRKNYFRIFYFLPNGEVYSIVTKFCFWATLYQVIKSSKKAEVNKFKYEFDVNDNLVVYIPGTYYASSIYLYDTPEMYQNYKKGMFIAKFKVFFILSVVDFYIFLCFECFLLNYNITFFLFFNSL